MLIEKGRYLLADVLTGGGPGKALILKESIEAVAVAGDGKREMGIVDMLSGTRYVIPPDDAKQLISAIIGEEI